MIILTLNGDWTVNQKGSDNQIPATVPGCVHTDLLQQGLIPDPHYRDNEKKELQWISEQAWDYQRTFDVDAQCLENDTVLLRCEGLDTLATIFVNDTKVGAANNFHRLWEYDVKNVLRVGTNTIRISFDSIIPFITLMDEKEKPMPVWKQLGAEHRYQWIRKPATQFGWDWGPCLMTTGIFRDISIVAFNTARIEDVIIKQEHSAAKVRLDVDVQFNGDAVAGVTLSQDGGIVATGTTMDIENPDLWWPKGMGEQPLYDIEVILKDPKGSVLDTWKKRIGLRTLELVCEDDEQGQGMEFRANGIPFFAKGACWIPEDNFLNRVTPEIYRQRLSDAAAANMNMVRVWGGGYYEQELFYDICDELGLVVWQDFMFACAGYPAHNDDFIANVKEEAIYNIKRLRHHASIGLWCGNNELELGHEWDLALIEDKDGKMLWKDYSRLFDELLKDAVAEYDPSRSYWPSSPHSPIGDRSDACNPNSGNAHFWYVGHWAKKPIEFFRTSQHRFISEFGMQSFPEPRTMNQVTLPGERNLTSYMMEYRQRCGAGNKLILEYMLDWFLLPKDTPMLFWVSQIIQGVGIKYGVEHWRRSMPRCMGTLYWQLNDIWAAPTWASIDTNGRWKALHYMAHHFFAPVLVSIVENSETLDYEIWVSSDRREEGVGELEISLMTADGQQHESSSTSVSIPATGSCKVFSGSVKDFINRHGSQNTLLFVRLVENQQILSENFSAFVKPKHLDLANPGLNAEVEMIGDTTAKLTIHARRPALWCWIECLNEELEVDFSDNFFHIFGEASRVVTLKLNKPMSADQLTQQLLVQTLYNTYTAEALGTPPVCARSVAVSVVN